MFEETGGESDEVSRRGFRLRSTEESCVISGLKVPTEVGLCCAASMASGEKKRRTEEENREFNQDWTELFAFICNTDGLPTCLICHEKFAHNKKSNLERHFTTKHTQFAGKYPTGDARKKAVEEFRKKQQQSSSMLSNWAQSSNNVNLASFAISLEIAKRGKPFSDGEYIKDCFIRASEELFRDFKNKAEIMKKIKDLSLSAKTVQDRTAKMS
ncbi:hypothetical protein AVEN_34727-1 [Araneus ventricosus]|uniref:SPIN-DOC-like zinc-finger domain-containing protein n=1 Tax=Araneus ventricosus TaxID=182803 RepID=A0A4Y2B0E0_ARAVE|nr:hypothetical protein AVEN_34727-1 [Araneus ventricosus]